MNDDRHTDGADQGSAGSLTRRRALQIFGAVPVAAALGGGTQQQKPLIPAVTSQLPNPPAPAPRTALRATRFFTDHEWKSAGALADYIIPKDESSGSATDAKVVEYMDFLLSENDASVKSQTAVRGGLAWLDAECHKRFGATFIGASDVQRRQVLDDIAFPAKAAPAMSYGVSFFNRFRDMTASGFYSSAMGWQDAKYVGNVFNPGYDGCPPAALHKLDVSYDVMKTRVAPQEK
jgi:hypothetical protein